MKILCAVVITILLTSSVLADYECYVAVDASRFGDGTLERPFRTLVEARDWIRDSRVVRTIPKNQPVTVHVGPGVYPLESTFELTSQDGGTAGAPVIYEATEHGSVYLQGGLTLNPSSFRSIVSAEVRERLDASVRDAILVCDLRTFPDDFLELADSYSGVPVGPWLYVDGEPMQLARWPNREDANKGWATFSKVVDTGLADPTSDNPTHRKKHPGSFVFDNIRPTRWKVERGVWLHGYWTHDWADEIIRIKSYDQTSKVISLSQPHVHGIKRGTWGKDSRRFYALNLFEELDSPGEWYLDRAGKQLYFYPPKNFKDSSVVLSTLDQPLVSLSGAKHVKLKGLTIQYSHGDGIVLKNVNHVEIAGCTIANLARSGITVVGNDNIVRSCHLHHLGTRGITLSGGNRKSLVPANNLVVNNDIHHFGVFQRTYAPGVMVYGCGQLVRNNSIHDAPHNAIIYGGNEHLLELNDVYRVVMETGDAGAFYTGRDWTSQGNVLRHNYIHHLGSGDAQQVNTMGVYLDDCDSGDRIEGNVFYKAGRAIMIGGGRDNPVINNLVVDCPIGLYTDGRGMTWKQWNNPDFQGWNLEEKAESLNYKSLPWSARYPHLANIMNDLPKEPLYNPIRRNVFINITSRVWSRDANVNKIIDKFEVAENLAVNSTGQKGIVLLKQKGFTILKGTPRKPIDLGIEDFSDQNFELKINARLSKELPSWEPIPLGKIGISPDPEFN